MAKVVNFLSLYTLQESHVEKLFYKFERKEEIIKIRSNLFGTYINIIPRITMNTNLQIPICQREDQYASAAEAKRKKRSVRTNEKEND